MRLRAHDAVSASDDDGRFLRQVVEKESENKKPQIPKIEKANR
jgi:hypothetical protein